MLRQKFFSAFFLSLFLFQVPADSRACFTMKTPDSVLEECVSVSLEGQDAHNLNDTLILSESMRVEIRAMAKAKRLQRYIITNELGNTIAEDQVTDGKESNHEIFLEKGTYRIYFQSEDPVFGDLGLNSITSEHYKKCTELMYDSMDRLNKKIIGKTIHYGVDDVFGDNDFNDLLISLDFFKQVTFSTKDDTPIWSSKLARNECHKRCSKEGGTWTGRWWTTVVGEASVCQCVKDSLGTGLE